MLLHPFHLAEVGGIAAKAKDIEAVKALTINGQTAQEAITQRSGITGEKMELDGYLTLEGDNIEVYDHMGKHTLCTMVQTNKPAAEQGHLVAMQVAAMKPVALDAQSVDQEFQFGDGDKATVAQWLAKQDKDLKITAFKRFTLIAD